MGLRNPYPRKGRDRWSFNQKEMQNRSKITVSTQRDGVRTKKTGTWTIRHAPLSVVNAVRRIVLSDVPTVALDDANVVINTSDHHDEFLVHRISLLPVCFGEQAIREWSGDDEWTVELSARCDDASTIRNVYARDLIVRRNGLLIDADPLFPLHPVTKSSPLLLRLRSGQEVSATFVPRLGTARARGVRWCPVSCCVHRKIDEDAYELEIESECGLSPQYLFDAAWDVLERRIAGLLRGAALGVANALRSTDIEVQNAADSVFRVRVRGHDPAVCSVVRDAWSRNDAIDFVACHRPHPVEDAIVFVVRAPGISDVATLFERLAKTDARPLLARQRV